MKKRMVFVVVASALALGGCTTADNSAERPGPPVVITDEAPARQAPAAERVPGHRMDAQPADCGPVAVGPCTYQATEDPSSFLILDANGRKVGALSS